MSDKTSSPKNDDLESQLDNDQQLMDWFKSRDPDRVKASPFRDSEMAEQYGAKPTKSNKSQDNTDQQQEQDGLGVSFTQHEWHIKHVSKNFTFIGIAIGLFVAIVLALVF